MAETEEECKYNTPIVIVFGIGSLVVLIMIGIIFYQYRKGQNIIAKCIRK
jgi:hypothetical protein